MHGTAEDPYQPIEEQLGKMIENWSTVIGSAW
jgi:hypothetical protein